MNELTKTGDPTETSFAEATEWGDNSIVFHEGESEGSWIKAEEGLVVDLDENL